MSNVNEIAVSFDEMMAVRLGDMLRLVAVPDVPNDTPCRDCMAGKLPTGRSCLASDADTVQHCSRYGRKDRRNITWRPA